MQRRVVLAATLLLCGCGGFNSPWGILVSNDDPPAAASGTNGNDGFVITTKASRDPRVAAQDYCAKHSRYARLTTAERSAGADPADETITWHFDCTN